MILAQVDIVNVFDVRRIEKALDNRNPLQAYKNTQIKTANQGTLIVMLYDGAMKFITIAVEALNEKPPQLDKISNNIIKAQDIITELMVSLDFEKGGEIAKHLFRLYVFINRQLLEANIKKDTTPLEEAKGLLCDLRAVWVEINKKNNFDGSIPDSRGVNIAG